MPDAAVEEQLVRQHLPLVDHLVAEMLSKLPRHVSRDDLRSAALAGLAQAARSWNSDRGVPFARYAATRMRGSMLDELRSIDWATRSVRTRSRRITAATEELTATLGRPPSGTELAARTGLTSGQLAGVSADVQRAAVLNIEGLANVNGAEAALPTTDSTPETALLDRERIGYLHDAVAVLPDRLRRVVIGYFFEERPMAELAEELGVTESRISQLRAEALLLLKDGLNSQLDPDVVESERSARRGPAQGRLLRGHRRPPRLPRSPRHRDRAR